MKSVNKIKCQCGNTYFSLCYELFKNKDNISRNICHYLCVNCKKIYTYQELQENN